MKSSKLWMIKWIFRQMLKINLVRWCSTKNVFMCFYVQNCRTHRSSNWYQVLVFEFSYFNNLWKPSFCNIIISEKGSAESGQMASYETHAARFCSATLLYFLVGRVRLWSDTIYMCSKKPVFELFYFPVAILLHRDCSGWQDHWNAVHVSHNLVLSHLIWRVLWTKWGQQQMIQSQQPPYMQHLEVLLLWRSQLLTLQDNLNFLYAAEHSGYNWGRTDPGSWLIANITVWIVHALHYTMHL